MNRFMVAGLALIVSAELCFLLVPWFPMQSLKIAATFALLALLCAGCHERMER